MTRLRRTLLSALPKVALSRLCGGMCAVPLPAGPRVALFRWFAQRYGVDLAEVDGDLASFRSMQEFFQRPLRPGARPIAGTSLVWPCDGRIVSTGAIANGELLQVKGNGYALAELLGDRELAARLEGGSQATIYLAPGDYHRVHAPFAASVASVVYLPGTLFPVNPAAVRCVPRLFARNSRHVFQCRLPSGAPAAVVMVGAYNVGGTTVTVANGPVRAGDELGRFGFGSTVVALVGAEGPRFADPPADAPVRMGAAATAVAAQ